MIIFLEGGGRGRDFHLENILPSPAPCMPIQNSCVRRLLQKLLHPHTFHTVG